MKRPLLLLLLIFTTHSQIFAQADSLRTYVTEALDIMKARSVNKNKVDWDNLYLKSLAKTDTASSTESTYPIILDALKQLKDNHSGFYPPELIEAYKLGYRAMGMEFPTPEYKMLEGKYAYILIPPFAAINLEEQREYSASIQAAITQLDKQNPEGWIIDLRSNDGGMSSPMLAGIGPFIEKEKAVGWKDADGKNGYWIYKKGKVYENDDLVFDMKIQPYKIKNKRKPMAVLVGKNTSSAGEVLSAAFVGRRNTKLIGTNTAGLTSNNNEHELSDGAYLVLTEGNYIDRNNKEYNKIGEGIAPDIRLENLIEKKPENNSTIYIEKAKEFLNLRNK
ncbi:S41 family peptidase [Pontibacter locisalis]|uniref:S41 family peptidase n=1 Tax=Pontibacter locisalis TaxID=1719035 RepID=A0ABW5IQN0_9BACT